MSHRFPITIRLDHFEGPLDLLLYLIQNQELDISKISISKITDQYLSYVRLIQELDFDLASEFLVMAATLIHWKSKALLPQENLDPLTAQHGEVEGLTQEELVRQLMEHQRFLAAGEQIAELPRLGEDVFCRENQKPPTERVWREMNITELALGYQDMLVRARKRTHVLKKETVSLTDKIIEFSKKLISGNLTEMMDMIADPFSRQEVVVTFLASLELSRLKKLRIHQHEPYKPIYLELLESLENFDHSIITQGAAPLCPPS